MASPAKYIPATKNRSAIKEFFRILKVKLVEVILGQLFMFDQDKIDYEMTFFERTSYLGYYLGRRRRGLEPRVAPFHEVGEWFMALFFMPMFRLFVTPFSFLMGVYKSFSIPNMFNFKVSKKLKKVTLNKQLKKAKLEGSPYGMAEATMVCQCDGHRLFLYGNAPLGILVSATFGCMLIFLLTPVAFGAFSPETSRFMLVLIALAFLLVHFPARSGVVFDRDEQTAMLIRGWLRKPLVVPFDGIFFTSYTEDINNFSKDLVVYSQYVSGWRKKPVRVALNTAIGSSSFSMAQVVGAVDCFMDQGNTQAMPLALKHSIEWHRKHKLTLWHMAWQPLPDSELAKYTAPNSLYQTQLLDPKTEEFQFQLTAEGRDYLRREALAKAYLAQAWQHLSIEAIEPELAQQAVNEFGQEALLNSLIDQIYSENSEALGLVISLREEGVAQPEMYSNFRQKVREIDGHEFKNRSAVTLNDIDELNQLKADLCSGLIAPDT